MTPLPAGSWRPPQDFSPERAFPPVVETADVSMGDVTSSPNSVNEGTKETKEEPSTTDEETVVADLPVRKVSTNAVKRVIKSRWRAQSRVAKRGIKEDGKGSDSETEDEGYTREGPVNHHYTFNMPGLPANRSEVPYMLLGWVRSILISLIKSDRIYCSYVQVLLNLCLLLVLLYLVVHLIINVQRDAEHRIEEYRAGRYILHLTFYGC